MRLIDADALIERIEKLKHRIAGPAAGFVDDDSYECGAIDALIDARNYVAEAPTVGGWISVKDRLPKEHPSMFAKMYGTEKWISGMWRTESDRVLVTIKFPDNTRTVDKGRLQDGTWRTGVSPVLPYEVTHWAVWPEPAEEV